MSFADKYNSAVNKFTWQTDQTFEFFKLQDLFMEDRDEVHTLRGLWVNEDSKYGPSPVAVLDDRYVNLPGHMLQKVRDIIADDEAVNDINAGKVGFTVYQYNDDKHDKTCFSIRFVDIKPEDMEDNLPFK